MTAISDAYLAWCKEMGIHHSPALAAAAFESGWHLGSIHTFSTVMDALNGKMPPTAPTAERQEVITQGQYSAKEGECQCSPL